MPIDHTVHGNRRSSARRPTSSGGPVRRRLGEGGFTLVEVLAALLMMAIIIPVTMEGMSVATRAGILGQRKAAAMRVAERVLNEVIVEGDTNRASSSGSAVDGDTTYPWTMTMQTWPEDPMQELTVTVTFTVQGSDFTVNISTLVPPSSADLDAMAASGAAGTTP